MGDWTLDECLSLIDQVRGGLPKHDAMSYAKRMKKTDFSTIQVAGKSNQECMAKMNQLLDKVRKFRTFTEIFSQIHADFSKDPKGAYGKYLCTTARPQQPHVRYFQRHYDKIKGKSNVAGTEVVRMAMKKYRGLPAEKKERYHREYLAEMAKFKDEVGKEAADFVGGFYGEGKDGNQVVAALACNLFINKKVDKKMKKHPDADKGSVMAKYRDRWMAMEDSRKSKYLEEAKALKNSEWEAEHSHSKRPSTPKIKKEPTVNGSASKTQTGTSPHRVTSYTLFIKECMAAGHNHDEAGKAWKQLPAEERLQWKEKAHAMTVSNNINNGNSNSNSNSVKKFKKATGWGLFVRKHIADGNSFQTAGPAWQLLSDKKKKKFVEKARKVNEEHETEMGKLETGSAVTTPVSASKKEKDRKRPATEPSVKTEKTKKVKKIVPISAVFTDSDDDDSDQDSKPLVRATSAVSLVKMKAAKKKPEKAVSSDDSDYDVPSAKKTKSAPELAAMSSSDSDSDDDVLPSRAINKSPTKPAKRPASETSDSDSGNEVPPAKAINKSPIKPAKKPASETSDSDDEPPLPKRNKMLPVTALSSPKSPQKGGTIKQERMSSSDSELSSDDSVDAGKKPTSVGLASFFNRANANGSKKPQPAPAIRLKPSSVKPRPSSSDSDSSSDSSDADEDSSDDGAGAAGGVIHDSSDDSSSHDV